MSDPAPISNARTSPGDARAALLLLAIAVAFITLYPFGFVRTTEVYLHQLRQALGDPIDLFLPLHALPAILAVWLLTSCRAWRSRLAPAVLVCSALFALELVQAGIAHRHARAGDLVVQWIGAGLGMWTAPLAARLWAHIAALTRPLWALLLLAWIALGCTVVIRGQAGHTISTWDVSFPFLLGAEYGGERRWSGTIHTAGVYAGPMEGVVAETLFALPIAHPTGIELRGMFDRSMIYDLAKGPDSLGTIDFDLRTEGVVYTERGLDLDAGLQAQGRRPAEEMSRAIVEAGAATIEVECSPILTEQSGPARLLTISKGTDFRNLTLAQEGDAVVLRVRTPRSGPNGADFLAQWPGVFRAGQRVHLIATTTGGRSRLWVNGVDQGERESVSKLGDWLKVRGVGKSWIAGVALLLPIGLIATRLGRTTASRGALAGAAGSIVVASALGYAQFEGRTWPMNVVMVALVCIALGLVLGWWLGRTGSVRTRAE